MRVGVLTGGGDCPGLNAVIRAVVRKGVEVYGFDFVGFRDGWRGPLENVTCELGVEQVRGILPRGGTVLRSSRTNPFKVEGGVERIKENLAANDVDALIERALAADAAVIDGIPDGVTVGMHICRGNYRSSWMCEGSLEPVAERVFGELPYDAFLVEWDDEGRDGDQGGAQDEPGDELGPDHAAAVRLQGEGGKARALAPLAGDHQDQQHRQ